MQHATQRISAIGRPENGRPASPFAWDRLTQIALIGIFIIMAFFALSEARAVLAPVAMAFIVGIILGPVSTRAQKLPIPTVIAAIGLWLVVVGAFYAIITLLWAPALDWISRAPEFGRSIEDKLHALVTPLSALPWFSNASMPSAGFDMVGLLKSVVILGTPAIGQIVIFFATLFFFLLARPRLRSEFIGLFKHRESRLRAIKIVNETERNLANYLGVVTIINAFVGIAAGLIATFVGLSHPIAWGLVGFLFNFVPYVGALTVEIAFFATGIVTFATLGQALLAPLLYLAATTLEAQLITPHLVGRQFSLNALTVFLSVVFWTWLWGPVGTFLAAPLAITAFAVIEHVTGNEEPDLPD
jgi:predicted PurR-regulated permease PerM